MGHAFKIILICNLFLVGCSEPTSETYYFDDEEIAIDHDYDEVTEYELVWESMLDFYGEYYVYIFSLTCNHCAEIKNFMIESALERKDIYFVKASSKDQLTSDPKMIKNTENIGDIWILGYPSLLKIVDQKVVKNLAGTAFIKSELK